VENKLEAAIPEIWETEEEKRLSNREIKDRNFSWALKNLRGKTYLNKSIKKNIYISRDGLGEWKTVTNILMILYWILNKKPCSSILRPTPKDQERAVIARFSATACL
jgi:hypothetical protein